MFRWAAFLGLAGLAAATVLIVWTGWTQVAAALARAGIVGIVAVSFFHCVPLVLSSAGWRALVPGKSRPSLPTFVYFMWIRAAVNSLMPVARIGGEIAAVRLMTANGLRRNVAIAATVVELTLSVVAIFLFILFGILAFALRVTDKNIVAQLAWGLLLSLPLLIGLAVVQKIGFFALISRLFHVLFRDKWASTAGSAARLDRAVSVLYRRKTRVLVCFLLQLAAWTLGSAEIWLALVFLGHPLPLLETVMIEALIQASSSAAFAIPGALGVQEAGFLFFGGMLGLSPGTAAALAVMRRCRDLLCYAPGLVAWQLFEGRRLLKK